MGMIAGITALTAIGSRISSDLRLGVVPHTAQATLGALWSSDRVGVGCPVCVFRALRRLALARAGGTRLHKSH